MPPPGSSGAIPLQDNGINLASLLQAFRPAGGSTTTSSETVSDAKTQALLRQLLSSSGGLAAVSSGQKGAGLYNSTVNTQMINDLLARATANTAALSSQKTQTTKPEAQLSAGSTLASLAASYASKKLLAPTLNAATKKLGFSDTNILDQYGTKISDAIFGNGGGTGVGLGTGEASAGVLDASSFGSASAFDSLGGGTIGSNITLDSIGLDTAAGASAGAAASGGLAADVGLTGAAAEGVGYSAAGAAAGEGAGAAAVGAGAAEGAGAAAGGEAVAGELSASTSWGPWGALAAYGAIDALSDTKKSKNVKIADWVGGLGTGNIVEGLETGNLADTLGPAGSIPFINNLVNNIGKSTGWIICTELNTQGRLPTRFYKYGARVFANYKESDKAGYYIWAIPTVRHLRKHPYSTYSKWICWSFNKRAEYLAAIAGCKSAKKTFTGWLITKSSYYICCGLARTIARKPIDFTQVYTAH